MTSVDASAVMDESISTSLPLVAEATVVAGCDVCAHPLDDHDRVARRYCTATFANAIARGCICR